MDILLGLILAIYYFFVHCMVTIFNKLRGGEKSLSLPSGLRRRFRDETSDVSTLAVTLQVKDKELDMRKQEVETLNCLVDALRWQVEQEKAEARRSREKHEAAVADDEHVRARLHRIELEAKQNASKVAELQRAYAHIEQEHRATVALLETRTSELKEAQAFLTKADNVADTGIQRIIEHLNSKIYQTAAKIADAPQFRYGNEETTLAGQAAQRLEKKGWLGAHLLGALHSIDHTRDPILVQTALQACMTAYVRWLAASWDLDYHDPHTSQILHEIYARIRQQEPQSVAGRWRAICRANVRALVADEGTEHQMQATALAEQLTYVLLACRVEGSPEAVKNDVRKGFNCALREIAELALEFQRVAGERVISRDFIAVMVIAGAAFDSTEMDDEWANPRAAGSDGIDRVLCTTQLGLTKEEATKDGVRSISLIKPKVVLRSMLHLLWNEVADAEH